MTRNKGYGVCSESLDFKKYFNSIVEKSTRAASNKYVWQLQLVSVVSRDKKYPLFILLHISFKLLNHFNIDSVNGLQLFNQPHS